MIEIYDEQGHISNVLEHGFDKSKWRLDLTLLVKFRKSEDPPPSKREVKAEMIEKCKKYIPNFREITDGPKISKLVDVTWKNWKVDREHPENSSKLRNIKQIEIPIEIYNWFLELPDSVYINDEQVELLRDRRDNLKITNYPININRLKLLFTLYVWTEIQKQYTPAYTYYKYDSCRAKLKKDSGVPTGFNMDSERNLLEDLGYIKTTMKDVDVIAIFYESDIFQRDYTNSEKIILDGEDLYNCGKWIEIRRKNYVAQKRETQCVFKFCVNCGKIFKVGPKGKKAKYCNSCAKMAKNKKSQDPKYCCECGKELVPNSVRIRMTDRCPNCQNIHRKKNEAMRQAELRKKIRK